MEEQYSIKLHKMPALIPCGNNKINQTNDKTVLALYNTAVNTHLINTLVEIIKVRIST